MLALLRSSLNTWPVRIFFMLLIAAFGLWGIGNVLPDILGSDGSAARVGGVAISPQDVQSAFRQQMQQTAQQLGSTDQITAEMRMMIAEQAAARLVAQTATDQMAKRMGLAAPDVDVRREVFAMDAFQGQNHQFSRAQFDQLLQANGLSETEFLHLMQAQIIRNQLLDSIRAAATAPAVMVKTVYAFENQTRIAALLQLPFAAAPAPAAPADAVLQRWYRNHPVEFSAPEYRRITLVILSPDVLARDVPVPDADIRAAYDRMVANTPTLPEKRTVEVVVAQSQAAADTLAHTWAAGADWPTVQTAAGAAGATALLLPNITASDVPSAALAQAAFKAPVKTVTGPIQNGAGGWAVLDVTAVTPGGAAQTYAQAAAGLAPADRPPEGAGARQPARRCAPGRARWPHAVGTPAGQPRPRGAGRVDRQQRPHRAGAAGAHSRHAGAAAGDHRPGLQAAGGPAGRAHRRAGQQLLRAHRRRHHPRHHEGLCRRAGAGARLLDARADAARAGACGHQPAAGR